MKAKRIVLIGLNIIAMLLAIYATGRLYENNKTDGHGNGQVKVSECKVENHIRKMYTCRGLYSSSAGNLILRDVTVDVTTVQYREGDMIADVYAVDKDIYTGDRNPGDTAHFITGAIRSSVRYNAGWLILLVATASMLFGSLVYVVGQRDCNDRKKVGGR